MFPSIAFEWKVISTSNFFLKLSNATDGNGRSEFNFPLFSLIFFASLASTSPSDNSSGLIPPLLH
ncbi:TPA: hypothetical protein HA318_05455 [Candidatus Micrarchaeota archaeon]|nr:hypothetical protein [Candidatus Micrarchaeota archaeon]